MVISNQRKKNGRPFGGGPVGDRRNLLFYSEQSNATPAMHGGLPGEFPTGRPGSSKGFGRDRAYTLGIKRLICTTGLKG